MFFNTAKPNPKVVKFVFNVDCQLAKPAREVICEPLSVVSNELAGPGGKTAMHCGTSLTDNGSAAVCCICCAF